jgi:hypothetical protein
MGAPISEVGYISATSGRGTTKCIWTCGGIGGKHYHSLSYFILFIRPVLHFYEPGVALWLKYCAISRKVTGSIPGGVTGDFVRGIRQFHEPGVDSSSKNEYQDTPGGKGGRCVWLTTYHLQVPMSRNLEALTSQNRLGPIGL